MELNATMALSIWWHCIAADGNQAPGLPGEGLPIEGCIKRLAPAENVERVDTQDKGGLVCRRQGQDARMRGS